VSVTFLSHWIEQHTPRLIVGIHRYIVHMLSTAYREAGQLASAVSVQYITIIYCEKDIATAFNIHLSFCVAMLEFFFW
jgi:hypothetical protein